MNRSTGQVNAEINKAYAFYRLRCALGFNGPMTTREIAEFCDCHHSVIWSIEVRVIKKLRKALEGSPIMGYLD